MILFESQRDMKVLFPLRFYAVYDRINLRQISGKRNSFIQLVSREFAACLFAVFEIFPNSRNSATNPDQDSLSTASSID